MRKFILSATIAALALATSAAHAAPATLTVEELLGDFEQCSTKLGTQADEVGACHWRITSDLIKAGQLVRSHKLLLQKKPPQYSKAKYDQEREALAYYCKDWIEQPDAYKVMYDLDPLAVKQAVKACQDGLR